MVQLHYTSVERVYQVEPDLGSVTNLTSAQIAGVFAQPAEALIDASIAGTYTVPVQGSPPLLQGIADDLTVYRILTRRIFTAQQLKDSPWPAKLKEAFDMLKEIAKGSLRLTTSSGDLVTQRTDRAVAVSNTLGYLQTFTEDIPESWVQDADKLDALQNERE